MVWGKRVLCPKLSDTHRFIRGGRPPHLPNSDLSQSADFTRIVVFGILRDQSCVCLASNAPWELASLFSVSGSCCVAGDVRSSEVSLFFRSVGQ